MFNIGEIFVALAFIFLPLILSLTVKPYHAIPRKLLLYSVFISVGLQGLLTGFLQVFKPEIVVNYVQWPYSPYLLELGMANAAFGIIGILAPWMDHSWKCAAAVGYGLFLLFTGIGHLVRLFLNGMTPGDFGGFLFSDLLVPVVLLIVVAFNRKGLLSTSQ